MIDFYLVLVPALFLLTGYGLLLLVVVILLVKAVRLWL